MEEKRNCPDCGARLRPGVRFCSVCGRIIKEEEKKKQLNEQPQFIDKKEVTNNKKIEKTKDKDKFLKCTILLILKYILKIVIFYIYISIVKILNSFSDVVIYIFPVLIMILFILDCLINKMLKRKGSKVSIFLIEKIVLELPILIGIVNYFENNISERISQLLIYSTLSFFLISFIFSMISLVCFITKNKSRKLNFWYQGIGKLIIISLIVYLDTNVINIWPIFTIIIIFCYNALVYGNDKNTNKKRLNYIFKGTICLNIPYYIISYIVLNNEYYGDYINDVSSHILIFLISNFIIELLYRKVLMEDNIISSNKKSSNITYDTIPTDINYGNTTISSNNTTSTDTSLEDYQKSEYHHYKTEVRCRVIRSYETVMFSREVVDIDVTAYYYFENGYGQKKEKRTSFYLNECDPKNYDSDALKHAESIGFKYMMDSFR